MKNILSDLAYDITQTIKGSGRVIMMYDEDGNRTYDQREAAKIFAYPDKMMVIITDDGIDSSVDVGLSQSTDVTELQDFITTLRHLCTNYNVLFNINKYGKEITPKDFANYGTSNDLSECLEYYNKNRVIVNELFKGDNIYEYQETTDGHFSFEDDYHCEYFLDIDSQYEDNLSLLDKYLNTESEDISWKEISSGKRNNKGNNPYEPTKANNEVQFKVLSTVIHIITEFIKNDSNDDETCYYFTGDKNNGLAKLYSKLFKNINTNGTSLIKKDIHFSDQILYCLLQKNLIDSVNESRIDELFKGDSDVEIIKTGKGYEFEIDFILYQVYTRRGEIYFANMDGDDTFQPSKNNKNQFLILNTVITCVEQILKTKEIYYFSGSNKTGLGKLYSIMFKKLKNKAIEMGYVTLECGEHHFDEDSLFDTDYKPFKKINGEEYFWFVPKEMMTDYVYNKAKDLDIDVTGYNSKINESLYGSKKSSYEKDGTCKLILRHSKTIDEDKRNSRTRNIAKIFLETDEGERIKCPVNNLKGARAWAKYVNKNGIIEDENTDRLFSLVEDLQYMKNLKKHLFKQRNTIDESIYNNEISGISEGIIKLTKMLNSASRTGKIPEVHDCDLEQELNEIYVFEDEELLEKAKRAKRRQQSLLAPVIQSEDIEMTETPFTKYAKKWLETNNKETSEKSINGLAEGLKEIVNDDVDYTIDFDPNDDEGNNIRKFADNIACPYTKDYILCLADKVQNGDELGKVEQQILRHIVNGVDSDENLNEFVEPEKEESPRKEIPNIGDQVATDFGPGTVVGKEGFTLDIELQNGKMIEANAFNVDVTYRPGKGEIEEMSILESFFKQF